MKEVVQKILQEEEKARLSVQQAKREADSIISRAKIDAARIIEDTLREIRVFSSQKIDEHEKALLAEKGKALKETREQSIMLQKTKENDVQRLAEEVFRQAVKIDT